MLKKFVGSPLNLYICINETIRMMLRWKDVSRVMPHHGNGA